MRNLAIAINVFCILALPSGLFAQISPISQHRTIEAYYEVYDSSEFSIYGDYGYDEASDMNPYHNNFNILLQESEAQGSYYANQQSSIVPTGINVVQEVYAFNEIFMPQWFMYGYTSSNCEFNFTTSEPLNWTLSGTSETEGYDSFSSVQIFDSNGISVVQLDFFEEFQGPFSESGTLDPGEYNFYAGVNADAEVWEEGISMANSASLILKFEVSPGVSPVGDSFVTKPYLRAGPNPMSERTMIAFTGAPQHTVQLDVFDVRGRLVKRLADAMPTAGEVAWDGRNQGGQKVPQGTYFLRMRSGAEEVNSKVLVVR